MNMRSKITVLFFALMMSVAAFADSPTSLTVMSASAHVYKVYYKANEAGKVRVSIINNSNKAVFSEVLNNVASFVRPYNFSELPEGEYTIVVEDKNGKQVEKVQYSMSKITSFISVTEKANDPNKYILNVVNNGTDVVSVKIFAAENLLHEQTLQVTGNFGQVYNLNSVRTTNDMKITFVVTTSAGITRTIEF
ncbi:MAG TPA: hypothetical protein VIM75_09815 [Ohtaekwangia sp.]|uniref:hypothetical protein n=1 Tax=Ohtaekwangia sp. TaxID=2066019 RepID=UPI002F924E92